MIVFCIIIFFFTPIFWIFSVVEIKKTPFFSKFVIINLIVFFSYSFLVLKPYFFNHKKHSFGIEILPIAFLIHTILVALISLILSKKQL